MTHIVKILSIEKITHDVLRIVTEKPSGYDFVPGQATDVCVNKDGWKEEKRAFTFTCLPSDNHLEFTTKTYPEHKGVTNQLLQLKKNDELILHDVFGDIAYKGEGVFIAGGAGITPFISIFRDLQSKNAVGNNILIFANKTKADIIHEEFFSKLLGKNFINILSDEKAEGCANGYINEAFLKANIPSGTKHIYLCGPPPMMEAVEKILSGMKFDERAITKEGF
ncbi:MAG TPA: flavodoxin reductase [Bacteroidia bacterium]|jgi:ferredoxin-NADP reductase|nr:flavodoxin reductase [Bacteroidia bacterium]